VSKGVDEKSISGPPSAYAQVQAQATPAPASSSTVSRVVAAQAVPVNRPSYTQPDPAYTQPKPGAAQPSSATSGSFYGDTYVADEAYQPRQSNADVSNDDLNALLDELGA